MIYYKKKILITGLYLMSYDDKSTGLKKERKGETSVF